MSAEDLIYSLYKHYKVDNNIELANYLNTTPQTISNWKARNSINAIKKKCRELGIYEDIFGDLGQFQNIENPEDSSEENPLENYFTALSAVAVATNHKEELKNDIKALMQKYLG